MCAAESDKTLQCDKFVWSADWADASLVTQSTSIAMAEEALKEESESKKEVSNDVKEEEQEKNGLEEAEDIENLSPSTLDLENFFLKPCMFEENHVLDGNFGKIEGAPNYRHIDGFPVFGTGQPTEQAVLQILNDVKTGKEEKIIWFLMRQEPVVYIDGQPYAPRLPGHTHVNIEVTMSVEQTRNEEKHLVNIIKQKIKNGNGKIKILRDLEFLENPVEREEEELEIEADEVKTVERVLAECADQAGVRLQLVRVPVFEGHMPILHMDSIVSAIISGPASMPCIFNCQMGKGRTTVGLVAACLIKEILLTKQLR